MHSNCDSISISKKMRDIKSTILTKSFRFFLFLIVFLFLSVFFFDLWYTFLFVFDLHFIPHNYSFNSSFLIKSNCMIISFIIIFRIELSISNIFICFVTIFSAKQNFEIMIIEELFSIWFFHI